MQLRYVEEAADKAVDGIVGNLMQRETHPVRSQSQSRGGERGGAGRKRAGRGAARGGGGKRRIKSTREKNEVLRRRRGSVVT